MQHGARSRGELCLGGRSISARRRGWARTSSACRSFSARNISASAKICASSIWPSRFPALRRRSWAKWRARAGVAIVASLFERRAPGLYHNTAVTLDAGWQHRRASIARCTSPTIRSTTRSITSRRAIWDSRPSTRPLAAWARWCAGTSGIRRARGSRRCRARRCCSIPPPSAGTRRRKMSSARRNMRRGRPSSARTPSPTACMWPA